MFKVRRGWLSRHKQREQRCPSSSALLYSSGPQQIGQCPPPLVRGTSLLSLLIQTLISFTDTPRNVFPAILASLSPVRLTHGMNCHTQECGPSPEAGRGKNASPPEPLEEVRPCFYLDFNPVILILDSWPPGLTENKFPSKFVMVSRSNRRKWIQWLKRKELNFYILHHWSGLETTFFLLP